MGWFGGGSPSKVSTVSEVKKDQFLEDLPPKFEDTPPVKTREPTLVDAARQIKLSDFSIEHFVSMPCFREAMITGFQAMGVLGTVTFLIHKKPNKSINWAVCGFFLGNVVGWEQCRSLRRRQFQMMEKARQKNHEKNAKKWEEKDASADKSMEQFNEFNSKNK